MSDICGKAEDLINVQTLEHWKRCYYAMEEDSSGLRSYYQPACVVRRFDDHNEETTSGLASMPTVALRG
ncbi:unnamed protein product [Taenia asiatica]|uniref:Uncharacterized protein n=1 Tax=Taenia asiatica TaxID=60517 RepID=A0A0R3VWE3_TAEAS|nr:unnamed protein product [Taenia asiatica]